MTRYKQIQNFLALYISVENVTRVDICQSITWSGIGEILSINQSHPRVNQSKANQKFQRGVELNGLFPNKSSHQSRISLEEQSRTYNVNTNQLTYMRY